MHATLEDLPNKKAKEAAEAAENRPANIRVMKVTMFPNNTFSSVEGVGDTILRGKFSVIGEKRDQLWMHITRFGFGRSVSGSVYSEGHGLSHEDAKSYWGKISVEGEEGEEEDNYDSNEPFDGSDPSKRLLVQGSVIYGFQLEPVPIGRFILREVDETDLVDDDEEDDDDDEENDGDEDDDDSFDLDNVGEDDGIDPWADSFQ